MLLNFYNKIGFAVCHQIPSRTIHVGGLKMPVCARDTGMYIGFLLTLAILLLFYSKANYYPQKRVFFFGFLAILFFAFDGITSYLGLRQTTNTIRLITGLPVGSFMAIILFSAFNETKKYRLNSNESKKETEKLIMLSSIRHQFLVVVSLIFAFFIINSKFLPLKYLLPTFIIIGIISAFILLNLTIINYFKPQKSYNLTTSLSFSLIELFVAYKLHLFFLNNFIVR